MCGQCRSFIVSRTVPAPVCSNQEKNKRNYLKPRVWVPLPGHPELSGRKRGPTHSHVARVVLRASVGAGRAPPTGLVCGLLCRKMGTIISCGAQIQSQYESQTTPRLKSGNPRLKSPKLQYSTPSRTFLLHCGMRTVSHF